MCKNCEKRDTCTELCEKAELYADQDYVSRADGQFYTNELDEVWVKEQWKDVIPNFTDSKILKQIILELHEDGYSVREIAEYVPCNFQYVHKIISSVYLDST